MLASLPETLVRPDGVVLRAQRWALPGGWARAVLLHGLGDRGERHAAWASELCGRLGLELLLPDLRGHGRSGGARGHVASFDEYLDDLAAWLAALPDRRPVLLLGASLGGLVALRFAQRRPGAARLAGIVAWAPLLESRSSGGPLVPLGLRLCARWVPDLDLALPLSAARLIADPAEAARRASDPDWPPRFTPAWWRTWDGARRRCLRDAALLRGPLLLLRGAQDPLVGARVLRRLAARCGPACAVTLDPACPGLAHELLAGGSPGVEALRARAASWLATLAP